MRTAAREMRINGSRIDSQSLLQAASVMSSIDC